MVNALSCRCTVASESGISAVFTSPGPIIHEPRPPLHLLAREPGLRLPGSLFPRVGFLWHVASSTHCGGAYQCGLVAGRVHQWHKASPQIETRTRTHAYMPRSFTFAGARHVVQVAGNGVSLVLSKEIPAVLIVACHHHHHRRHRGEDFHATGCIEYVGEENDNTVRVALARASAPPSPQSTYRSSRASASQQSPRRYPRRTPSWSFPASRALRGK